MMEGSHIGWQAESEDSVTIQSMDHHHQPYSSSPSLSSGVNQPNHTARNSSATAFETSSFTHPTHDSQFTDVTVSHYSSSNVPSKTEPLSPQELTSREVPVDSVEFQTSIVDHTTVSNPSDPTSEPTNHRSRHIDSTREIFTDSEKIAYVGLCKLFLVEGANAFPFKFPEFGSANASYTSYAKKFMRKLYNHMSLCEEEQDMVEKLPSHGVIPKDVSKTILQGCLTKSAQLSPQETLKIGFDDSLAEEKLFSEKITIDVRWTIILDLFLIMTHDDVYDSRSRTLLKAIAEELELDWFDVVKMEKQVAEQFQIHDVADTIIHNSEKVGRKKTNLKKRLALMGVATVGGGIIIGLSAGLLAPLIGSGLGAALGGIGLTSSSAFFGSAGGAALITTSGVVTGGTIAGKGMEKRTRGVDIFQFYTIQDKKRASVLISVTGWLPGKGEDVTKPFAMVDPIYGDHFSLLWEPEALKQLGNSLKLLAGEVLSFAAQEILRHTLLSTLMAALSLPMALAKLGYLVDNPWSTGLSLSEKAGKVLADVLLNHAHGIRPVSLVGFSLGARVIFYCLHELARVKAYGIVENVYIFGAPVTASKRQWRECASVVSGRFVNGHVKSDWILGFLYRAASTTYAIAGLNPVIDVAGVENMDVTHLVSGHLAYRHMMPTLMKECGIPVVSETFEEEEEEDENNGISELEVSDNLEAVMSGQVPLPSLAPKAPGPRSWLENPIFDKLRWSSKAQRTSSKDNANFLHSYSNESSSNTDTLPKAKSPAGLFRSLELPDDSSTHSDATLSAPPRLRARNSKLGVSSGLESPSNFELELSPPSQARTKHRS